MSDMPSTSIKLLLPAPGTPVIPNRIELPLCGRHSSSICSAKSRSESRELSIRVMACASIARCPFRIPSTYCWRERERRRETRAIRSRGGSGATRPGRTRNALSFSFGSAKSGMSSDQTATQNAQNLLRCHRNDRARPVHANRPRLVEEFIILRRNDATHDH